MRRPLRFQARGSDRGILKRDYAYTFVFLPCFLCSLWRELDSAQKIWRGIRMHATKICAVPLLAPANSIAELVVAPKP